MTGKGSVLCACCLKGHSDLAFTKASNLRTKSAKRGYRPEEADQLRTFEEEILVELNSRPPKTNKMAREPECWR